MTHPPGPRIRVLYVVDDFPQVSQTYLRTELASVARDHDVRVLGCKPADRAYADPQPFTPLPRADVDAVLEGAAGFRPHVLHTHYLHMAPLAEAAARRLGVGFTLRTHSFDVLPLLLDPGPAARRRRDALAAVRSPHCLRVLAFPFLRGALVAAGVPEDRLVDAWPVVDVAAFHDRGPRGPDVLDVGAALPKKRMEDFLDLAARVPGRRFRLYAMGYRRDGLVAYARRVGSPAEVLDAVDPSAMPAVYRAHGWLVYTACPRLRTVGWPMAVAEAQAAGLGVVMARVRPDLSTYVGPAGFLYDDIAEVPAILARGYPEELRLAGFEQARRSDIEVHRGLLTDVWAQAAAAPTGDARPVPTGPPARPGPGRERRWLRPRGTGPLPQG